MIDSGAGMSGTSSTNNLKNTMRCKIPITPAFGSVMDATSEGTINDQTLGPLGIRAIHIEGMHHNLLSVYQVRAGGESGEEHVMDRGITLTAYANPEVDQVRGALWLLTCSLAYL